MTENIGMQLRQARMNKDLTLEQISEKLFIRVPYLQALEDGNFESIPTSVQLRGFLRSYADYLGLSSDEILSSLRAQNSPAAQAVRTSVATPTPSAVKPGESASITKTIFAEIGQSLYARREILGLSMEDIEAHTHIPHHYVQFLEDGDFDRFPSPTQARGMLSNYVSFLDLDSSEIMLRYAEALQARLTARQDTQIDSAAQPKRVRPPKLNTPRLPPWFRMFFSPDTFLVGIIGVVVVGFIIWGIGRITRTQSQLEPIPTAPSLVEALLPTSTIALEVTNTPQQVTPTLQLLEVEIDEEEATQIPTVPVSGQSTVQIFVIVRQRAYLRVVVDGETAFDGRVLSGESYTFNGQEQIEVLTGNAAALQVFLNEQDMGTLGIFGEVANMIYTREGVVIPTALPTPTLSPEELATATPTPTPTPSGEDINLPPSQNTPIP